MNETPPVFYPDFFVTPRMIWLDKDISPMGEKVYSVVYWYSKLKDGYCHASNATIAKNIGRTNVKSVSRCVAILIEKGYIQATYDNDNQRQSLIPMIEYGFAAPPQFGGGPLHNLVDHNKNNIEKESLVIKFDSDDINDIHRLHKGWLIEMVIGPRKWAATVGTEHRLPLLEEAAKKVRLTSKRYQKYQARLDEIGYNRCAKAIRNISQSEHHRGINDRGWKATPEWLFNSLEKTEEWANR